MPLPPPTAERTRIHARNVQLYGFKRTDGLWDIEARLTDTKDHDYPISSGLRQQGDAVHDMWVRLTIDRHMGIVDATVCTDAMPYVGYCDRITPDYAKLVGLNLFQGFRKTVKDLFANTRGCSHLSEMLMFLPTVALQTFASEVLDNQDTPHKPYQLDKCHALDSHSEVVQRYYPRWYRGEKNRLVVSHVEKQG
jgi:hypothetical protein